MNSSHILSIRKVKVQWYLITNGLHIEILNQGDSSYDHQCDSLLKTAGNALSTLIITYFDGIFKIFHMGIGLFYSRERDSIV